VILMHLVSYDVRGLDWSRRGRIHRLLFGAVSRKRSGGVWKEYEYAGLLDRPNARWIGQSVVLLRPGDAEELVRALRAIEVPHSLLRVSVGV